MCHVLPALHRVEKDGGNDADAHESWKKLDYIATQGSRDVICVAEFFNAGDERLDEILGKLSRSKTLISCLGNRFP
jgi:hypothetical protein